MLRNGVKDFMDNFNVLVEIFVVTWVRKFGVTRDSNYEIFVDCLM